MPTYDYFCEHNGKTLEVRHAMNDVLNNWGDLCSKAGLPLGDTPAEAPVKKLATGGQVVKSSALNNNLPPCATGGGCSGGACGFN